MAPDIREVRPPSRPRRRIRLILAVVALLFILPALIRFAAEWPWFQALGYQRVFTTRIESQLLLFVGTALVAFLVLFVNLGIAEGTTPGRPRLLRLAPDAMPIDLSRVVRWLSPAAIVVALFVGLGTSGSWLDVLRFLHRVPFGTTDPVFGRDVSYYVFTMPIIDDVLRLFGILIVLALIASAAVHAARGNIDVLGRRTIIERPARWHLAILVAVLFVLAALRVQFVRLPDLLYSTTGPLFGASYSDLHGKLIGLRLLALAALAGAGIVLWGASGARSVRAALIAIGVYVGVSVLGVGLYPTLINRLVVAPNELVKETPQLASHIKFTRKAWGLDSVTVRDLSGEATLTEKDIRANGPTIDNIRLWDRDPLLQTFGQLQEIRTYYDFLSVDDDRYWINGRYRQVLLSPRELNTASLPTRTFINERLTFTHGMGLTMSPVNQVTGEGLPVLFIKDLPPASSVSLKVTRPEIYYGEITDSWVFANTHQKEFDYPSGDDNVYTSYAGDGGVRVGSFLRRVVLATYFRSLKVLLSSDINNDSRAMWFRNIRVRARMALPFLVYDRDPYLVVDDSGRLKWILDGYTWSKRYPYAQPIAGGVNYMRNSVKVVIDAYNGAVTAYISDPTDPIVQSLSKAFPGILHPLDDMPKDLRAHLRYPEDLFRVQSDLYATYHMDEPQTFYHREDQWQKPVLTTAGTTRDPFLRHIIMRLPGESKAEFIFMVPFTPRGKDNLASWMVARNDGEHYGKLAVYRLPKQSLVFGPTQIINRINQNTDISRQLSLWDQRGSEVIRGHLLVIPIEESLIYVQPIYLRAEGGRIPELKRVVIAHENQVVMAETLEEGLAEMFGGGVEAEAAPHVEKAGTPSTPSTLSGRAAELARKAGEAYRRALDAQKAGDWARYGDEWSRLGELLRELEATTNGD